MTAPASDGASPIRVRFAPSPTGDLHVGGVRTALYNWLFARRQGGVFILRVEDTDEARSTEQSTRAILDGMAWLGMHADEGPFFQSDRTELYRAKLAELVASGGAYRCWCSKETLDERRAAFEREKKSFRYERTCRGRTEGPSPDAPFVYRAKLPADGEVVVDDLILGEVVTDNRELDDFVLARGNGSPVYNFCVVVDDIDMRVTHVIRGGDHLANTPKQIHLYDLFGVPRPKFAHLPMIHGMDGKKLSKRHGAASIMQFKELGYLPETMLSFLARLGWSHGDQEVFEVEELQRLFDLKECGKSAGIFDMKKLDWQNGLRIRQMAPVALLDRCKPFLDAKGLDSSAAWLPRAVVLVQERARTLVEAVNGLTMFFDRGTTVKFDEKSATKFLTPANRALVAELADCLAPVEPWLSPDLERAATAFLAERGLDMKQVGQPARVALTGGTVSPPLFDCMEVWGRDVTLARLRGVV
ncbi:MAG: glutamate--tRNA ligase [Planctomycetes bacterium]|nr:glutamate--tRNA ligase [Planctomycetota bacterium]